MSLRALTSIEKNVVFECLFAAANGPFFPDWEFETLVGVPRERVREIVKMIPNIDDSNQEVTLAINNSMNYLSGGYPHGKKNAWQEFISVSEEEVDRILDKWRTDVEWGRTGGQS